MRAARNAVLNTTETLLNILRQCDPQTLLTLRRVSKQYNALIMCDTEIQRALFLAPLPSTDRVQWIIDKNTRIIKRYEPGEEHVRGLEWTKRQGAVKLAELNPIVFKRDTENVRSLEQRFELCETMLFTKRPDIRKAKDDARLVNHMFVAQPPPKKVEVYFSYWMEKPRRCGSQPDNHSLRVTIENKDGVTVGDVTKEFQAALRTKRLTTLTMPPGPLDNACLKIARCYVWMKGVVFASAEEIKAVEAGRDAGPKTPTGRTHYWSSGPERQEHSRAGGSPRVGNATQTQLSDQAVKVQLFAHAAQAGEGVVTLLERIAAEQKAKRLIHQYLHGQGPQSLADVLRAQGMDV